MVPREGERAREEREEGTGVGRRRKGIGAEKGERRVGDRELGWLGDRSCRGGRRETVNTGGGCTREEGGGEARANSNGGGGKRTGFVRKDKERETGRFTRVIFFRISKRGVLLKTCSKRRRFVK